MTIEERYLQPDWSKAPEDAEFYAPMSPDGSYFPVWIEGDLDHIYWIKFALTKGDGGDFTNDGDWDQNEYRYGTTRAEYYKSALIPRPAGEQTENDWVNQL